MMMDTTDIGEVIAIRVLHLDGDRAREVAVRIGKPRPFPDMQDYYCPYEIVGLSSEKRGYAAGVDAVQALQLVMVMIGARLYTSKEAKSGQLTWEGGEKGDWGFPVP